MPKSDWVTACSIPVPRLINKGKSCIRDGTHLSMRLEMRGLSTVSARGQDEENKVSTKSLRRVRNRIHTGSNNAHGIESNRSTMRSGKVDSGSCGLRILLMDKRNCLCSSFTIISVIEDNIASIALLERSVC